MRNHRLSFRKLTGLLSFVCVALVSMSNLCTQHAQVSSSKSVRFVAQSPLTSPTMRGRYNGKLVFSSDRGNDGGIKLWTMSPDGSNQTQLTFESDRGPNLPAYIPVYDRGPKWSPGGTKIAFLSMRDYDPQNPALSDCSIYIMDYQSHNLQRLILFDRLRTLGSQPVVIGSLEWSPDSSKFVFDCKEKVPAEPDEQYVGNQCCPR